MLVDDSHDDIVVDDDVDCRHVRYFVQQIGSQEIFRVSKLSCRADVAIEDRPVLEDGVVVDQIERLFVCLTVGTPLGYCDQHMCRIPLFEAVHSTLIVRRVDIHLFRETDGDAQTQQQ